MDTRNRGRPKPRQILLGQCDHLPCRRVFYTTIVGLPAAVHIPVLAYPPLTHRRSTMLSACARAQSRVLLCTHTFPSPTAFRVRFQTRQRSTSRMQVQSQSSPRAPAPKDPSVDKTDALRMLKFINYAWTPYHVVGTVSISLRRHLPPVVPSYVFNTFDVWKPATHNAWPLHHRPFFVDNARRICCLARRICCSHMVAADAAAGACFDR